MKKIIKFCCVVMLIVSMLTSTSCKPNKQEANKQEDKESMVITEVWHDEVLSSDESSAVYEYYFKSVRELLYAIKHEPDKYNNARIKVIGTIQTGLESTSYDVRLVDYAMTSDNIPTTDGVEGRYQFREELDKSASKIEIVIKSEAQYAVAESGDYVKVYGTVKITRDRIFIDDCEYDLIVTLLERVEIMRLYKLYGLG